MSNREWLTSSPETLQEMTPLVRLMDRREPDYDPSRPYITCSASFAVWYHKGSNYLMVTEMSFRTDLATIPRILWPIVSPRELGLRGVVFHDKLIRSKGNVDVYKWNQASRCWVLEIGARRWTRKESDRFFFRLMREDMEEWKTKPGAAGLWQVYWRRFKRRSAFKVVRSWAVAARKEWGV